MQEVDLSALGAQAIAQVERTRKQAAAQLAAAMHQRPKLALHAQLDGPKIAVPIPASADGLGALQQPEELPVPLMHDPCLQTQAL